MQRRAVLSGIASGVPIMAGCLGTDANEGKTADDSIMYEIEAEINSFEPGYPLDATVKVVSHATEATPARIKIGLTNAGDTTRRIALGATPPFTAHRAERVDGNAVAHLAPDSRRNFGLVHVNDDVSPGENPSAPIDGCWIVEGTGMDYIATKPPLEPGETLSDTYSVFANADNEDCLPAGTYRFEETSADFGTSSPWVIDVVVKESNGS